MKQVHKGKWKPGWYTIREFSFVKPLDLHYREQEDFKLPREASGLKNIHVLIRAGFCLKKEGERANSNYYGRDRGDFSTWHTFYFHPETGEPDHGATCQGYRDGSAWARGQAWGIYGTALAYRYTRRKEYIDIPTIPHTIPVIITAWTSATVPLCR